MKCRCRDRGQDRRVVDRLEAARRPLQRVLVRQREPCLRELRDHLLIGLGRPGRGVAQPRERRRLGLVEAGGEEALLRRQVEIQHAGIVLRPGTCHRDAGVGLVGILVLGEAHVPVDAEERRLAVALDRDFRLRELERRVLDEVAHRTLDAAFVGSPVLLEPFLRLVERQRLEERQRLAPETLERHVNPVALPELRD